VIDKETVAWRPCTCVFVIWCIQKVRRLY